MKTIKWLRDAALAVLVVGAVSWMMVRALFAEVW